jgi:hypothetical protein
MTMRVVHYAEDRIDLRADGFNERCYILYTADGWWLHLEPTGRPVVDRRGLSAQGLLDILHEVVKTTEPGQFVHWADVWLYMRVADHKLGNRELEDCKIDTRALPPKLLYPAQTLPIGSRIRILKLTRVSDLPAFAPPDVYSGATGRIIAPEPTLLPQHSHIIASVKLDPEFHLALGESIHLTPGDKYEVVKESA